MKKQFNLFKVIWKFTWYNTNNLYRLQLSTAVRRISLVWDNAEHVEGKDEGQQVVILTQYVKKL